MNQNSSNVGYVQASPAELTAALADAGYIRDRKAAEGIQYVLMVIYDPQRNIFVGLLKNRGPEFLIGKLTFPGGKVEAGETSEQACSRETKEEAGLTIPVDAWKFVARSSVVMVMAAVSSDVIHAKQCDDELIFVMNVDSQLKDVVQTPEAYAPDFSVLLKASITVLA